MTAARSIPSQTVGRRAFTLLELLVAMSVLSLLLVLLLSIVNGATRLWRVNENRVDSYREARAAINLISSDLASILSSRNEKFFYTHDDHQPATPVSIKGMDGSLFFVTAIPSGAQDPSKNKSDLCTVGYYLGFDKTSLTGKGQQSYNLYRYFRSSDDTYKALTAGDILSDVTVDTTPTSTNSEVLAKNITGFTVVPYEIPAYDPANPDKARNPVPFKKSALTPLPDMLEITVKAISNDSARRFDGQKAAWEDENSNTRRQEERAFTARIYLAGAEEAKSTPSPPAP